MARNRGIPSPIYDTVDGDSSYEATEMMEGNSSREATEAMEGNPSREATEVMESNPSREMDRMWDVLYSSYEGFIPSVQS